MSILFSNIATNKAAIYASIIGSNIGAFLTPTGALAPDPDVASECHVDHRRVGECAKRLGFFAPFAAAFGAVLREAALAALFLAAALATGFLAGFWDVFLTAILVSGRFFLSFRWR